MPLGFLPALRTISNAFPGWIHLKFFFWKKRNTPQSLKSAVCVTDQGSPILSLLAYALISTSFQSPFAGSSIEK